MTELLRRIAATALLAMVGSTVMAQSGSPVAELEIAAAGGDAAARNALAVRYEHAEGVPRNLSKAHELYCLAARDGLADAQFNLGWVYANGRGVSHDDSVAAALFRKAAAQGHAQAARLLDYVHDQRETRLPPCLTEDPPVFVIASGPDPSVAILGTPHEVASEPRNKIEQLVYRMAPSYAVDPKLALAVISAESDFNPAAVSPKQAQGLMQLIPETAERFGVKRVFDPVENIRGGLAYLRWLLAFFQGDVPLVLAAYNAGEQTVEKYRGIPPYAETRRYVRRITGVYTNARHPYDPAVVLPSTIMTRIKKSRG